MYGYDGQNLDWLLTPIRSQPTLVKHYLVWFLIYNQLISDEPDLLNLSDHDLFYIAEALTARYLEQEARSSLDSDLPVQKLERLIQSGKYDYRNIHNTMDQEYQDLGARLRTVQYTYSIASDVSTHVSQQSYDETLSEIRSSK